MKPILLALVGSALLCSGGAAWAEGETHAEPLADLQPKERGTTKSFYGWEILVTGEIGGLMTMASVTLPDKPVDSPLSTAGFLIGAPAFVLSGPIVHWSHDHFSKGLVSLAGNVALPVVGGLVGRSLRCGGMDSPSDCAERGFLTGFGWVAAVTPILDALVLGWEDLSIEDAATPLAPTGVHRQTEIARSFSLAPTFAWDPAGRFTLGVGGQF